VVVTERMTLPALTSGVPSLAMERAQVLSPSDGRASRLVRFVVVGLSGLIVNEIVFGIAVGIHGADYLIGAVIATQSSTAWNFAIVERWVFAAHRTQRARRFAMFWSINMVGLGMRGPFLALLIGGIGVHYLIANVVTLGGLTLARFAVADVVIWRFSDSRRALSGGPMTSQRALDAVADDLLPLSARTRVGPVAATITPVAPVIPGRRREAPLAPIELPPIRLPDEVRRPGARPERPNENGARTTPDHEPSHPPRRRRIRTTPGQRMLRAAPLVSALAFGTALRFWDLTRLGFNSDEAVYAGQGASIAGNPAYLPYFPVFRAHPLLFQTLVSLGSSDGVMSEARARGLAATFGVGLVILVYLLGSVMFDRRVGVVAALFAAVMPYAVVVSRQVLLDGPMAFFATLALLLIAKYATTERPGFLMGATGALALAFLSKETSVVLLGSIYAFFALAPDVRVRFRHLVLAGGVFGLCILPYPLSLVFAGHGSTGNQFLAWQLFRRPNHPWTFYAAEVPAAIGFAVLAAALIGVAALWRRRTWRLTLLGSWLSIPVFFFQLWPVKGWQYLIPAAAPISVLAGLGAVYLYERARSFGRQAGVVVLVACGVSLLTFQSIEKIRPSNTGTFLAGSGGVPGGRETGTWIGEHVPEGARMLALGPSMANILQFYGQRKVWGLSVSTNPLHRNPVYEPIANPDRMIRTNEIQYLVWDSYSASRSRHFSEKLLQLADRYNGRVVYRATVRVRSAAGALVEKTVIAVYEVRP